jgi:hypothetical protein
MRKIKQSKRTATKNNPIQKKQKKPVWKRKRFVIASVTIFALLSVLAVRLIRAAQYDGYQRLRIVAMANSQLGVQEDSAQQRLYSEGAAGSVQEWCANFVSWVYKEAGYPFFVANPQPGIANWRIPAVSARTGHPNLKDFFITHQAYKAKETGYIPAPGDVVIFARNGRSHTGIVYAASKPANKNEVWIDTVEGNTASNNVGKRSYPISDPTIDGYGVIINSGMLQGVKYH